MLLWVGGIVIAGRHVHHFNFGIGLLTAVGGVAVHGRPWRHNLTEPGPAGPIPDLLARDFTADAPGTKMVAADPARGVAGSAAVGYRDQPRVRVSPG